MKLFSTSCETLFLGWDAPLLPRAVSALVDRMRNRVRLDLSQMICVLPTSRGVVRLRSLLQRAAEELDLQYDAPEIITVGQLAERLYQSPTPLALELEQTLAWARVLRAMQAEELSPLIPNVPSAEPIGPWMEIAGTLRQLHEELSASELTFHDVIETAETDAEKRRWKLLSDLFDSYRRALADAGLSDPHWSRRQAVLGDQCQCDRTIVLIGTSDLSDALVEMLRVLDSEVIAMVAAPPGEAFRFDEFGCVETSSWLEHHLPLSDEHLVSASDIADQAAAVAESLAEFADGCTADQVTVGVTDESHVGPIETELRGCAVSTHRQLGWTIAQTSIGRLLDRTSTYLTRRTWQALAALVRHADVAALVSRRVKQPPQQWLTELDQLLAEFFPVRVADPLSAAAIRQCPLAKTVADTVEDWLATFAGGDQSIAKWNQVIGQWLEELYPSDSEGGESHDDTLPPGESASQGRRGAGAPALPGRYRVRPSQGEGDARVPNRTALAVDATRRVVGRFTDLNTQLDVAVSGSTAIEMLASRLVDVRVQQPAASGEVKILGWLDLALDDAEAMVVNGLNHPFVPAGVTSDPFLPGALRTRLRMADNDRRYARDLYAMHLMLSTRSAIRFIVGSTAADQSPTPPSRLLAAASGPDVARRIRTLLRRQREPIIVHHRWDDGPQRAELPIPKLNPPQDRPAVTTMSVTAFRDFLTCPYRFYLRHVLKLKPLDDSESELAANQFGDLVHAALERFGVSSDRDETDRSKIEAMLIEHLHDYADDHYGSSVSTAVTLQIAQAERRLKAVAHQQALRIADGWKIYATEASVDEDDGAGIDVDGKRMGLRGRFDRIDVHGESGRWAILDYKTHGHTPEKKHLKKTEVGHAWIDLQLPLYRMMIPFLGIDAEPDEVQLGYFNISEKAEETRINIADFTPEQLQQADETIRDCVARIWAGDFAPTSDRVTYDDYGMILQTGVASRLLDQVDSLAGSGPVSPGGDR